MNKKEYALVDLFKLMFAVAVVIIHTQLFSGCKDSTVWFSSSLFTRLAVPFFMIVSSCFLGMKIREKGHVAFKAYRKTLWPKLLFWGGLNLFFNAIVWYKSSANFFATTLSVIQQMLFYPMGAMWFVLALIVSSYILEFFLKKHVAGLLICVVSLCLFIFALLCNTYYFLVENTEIGIVVDKYLNICLSGRNGVFLFAYMFIGYSISSNRLKIQKRALCYILVLGYLLIIIESIILFGKTSQDDSSLLISYLVFVPALVLYIMKCDSNILHHKALRSISSVMYYTHPLINLLLGTYVGMKYGILRFAIVISLSVIIWGLTKDSKNRFLRKVLY